MFFITFLCIVIAFACIIVVTLYLTEALIKWDDKRKIERGKQFNKEWDEKTLSWVRKAMEDVMPKHSEVEDVEYEDVSNQKFIEK